MTNFDSNTVSVIEPDHNTVTGSPITVGTAPTGVGGQPRHPARSMSPTSPATRCR
ncbi:PE-PGRS family protein [Mycobacterium tuberculosis CPHL_A]|nr:PE-PGRS family protein [Mycobacterium tuberculosis CPHL_A]